MKQFGPLWFAGLIIFVAYLWRIGMGVSPVEGWHLIFGFLGVIALAIAVYELRHSFKKPEVSIRVVNLISSEGGFLRDGKIVGGMATRKSELGLLEQPVVVSSLYKFPFKLLAENTGDIAVSKFKASINLIMTHNEPVFGQVPSKIELKVSENPPNGRWIFDSGETELPLVMRGDEDWVIFSHKGLPAERENLLDYFGRFELIIPCEANGEKKRATTVLVTFQGLNHPISYHMFTCEPDFKKAV